MLDAWAEDALEPATGPGRDGEWPLNRLRWTLLQAALAAPPSTRMAAHFPRIVDALAAAGLSGPEPLAPHHRADGFDCGADLLNEGLRKSMAAVADDGGERTLATRVITEGNAIAGYYSTRPVAAVLEADPARRIPLLFVARCAVDRRRPRPLVADSMFLRMLAEAWDVAKDERPAAVLGLTVGPGAKRFFRRIGVRPLGDAVHVGGIIVPACDLAAASAYVAAANSRPAPKKSRHIADLGTTR